MGQIEDDFVRYVFHLQVVVDEEPRPDIRNISYSAPEDPVQGSSSIGAAMAAEAAANPLAFDPDAEAPVALATETIQQQPVRAEKTPGRNEPCFCGSGKKYKLCHGR